MADIESRSVPVRALVLAFASLAVPLLATYLVPSWLEAEGALIAWLPAVVPGFLLAYYRGWGGASLSLAATMATLALVQVEVQLLGIDPPGWGVIFAIVTLLVTVTLGAGWLASVLRGEREKARNEAFTDVLTGIANRRYATNFLGAAWASARRGSGLAVALFDLDQFKGVNDAHGHAEGDRVLRTFAGVLEERTRRMDLAARFGGEEFITILVDCTAAQAMAFAEDVRQQLAAWDFGWGTITVSAGIAAVEEGMGSPDVLVAAADRALYQAKSLGRDRAVEANSRSSAARSGGTGPGPLPALHQAKVIVVDDDTGAARATGRLLERLGVKPTICTSPRDAVRRFADREPFDVIVTDIVMPEMSGFTLVELAVKAHPGIRAIFMSGYLMEEVYWGGTPGARSAFVQKPIELDDLRDALRRLATSGHGTVDAPQARPPKRRPTAPPASTRPVPDSRAPRILILDDDPVVAKTLARIVDHADLGIPLAFADPRRAVEKVAAGGIDLLVTDIHMPEMNGLEVLAAVMDALDPDEYFPVLVLTGDDDPDLRRRALQAGAMDFLAKPFDTVEAQARVRNLLAARRIHRSISSDRDVLELLVRERTSELADSRSELLHRLARAAEYRDDVTGRHAERVGLLSSLIADELGLAPKWVDLIRRAAPLHDIGKIGVPDAVLRKPGRLTPIEFEIMKAHTSIGAEILGDSDHELLACARKIAHSHHERFDGLGYPLGLRGEDIPLEARIVAVADVFDVLTHDRPYKQGRGLSRAVTEIAESAGTHLDPRVVGAFLRIYDRTGSAEFLALADPFDPQSDVSVSAS